MPEQSPDPDLRAALTSAANSLHPTPPPFSAIRAAGRRRRRQRVVLATAVSAVAIAGVTATALAVVPQRSQVGEPVAPSASTVTPAPSSTPTHPTSTASSPASSAPSASSDTPPAAPCTTAQLKVSDPGSAPAAGSVAQVFTITNVSSQPCRLPHWVTNVHGTTNSGSQQVLRLYRTGPEFYFTGNAATLPADGHAGFGFTESDPSMCGTPQSKVTTITSVTFSIGPKATFTKNLLLPANEPDPILLSCGAHGVGVSQIGTLVPPPKPKYDVETTRTVPATVAAGQKLNYTITLTNKSKVAAPLTPCPSYTAFFEPYPSGQKDQASGQLDCAGQASLPPGGSISFHLTIVAPPQSGRLKLVWSADRFHTGTGAPVAVTK